MAVETARKLVRRHLRKAIWQKTLSIILWLPSWGLRGKKVDIITHEYQEVDIVDGQQRITTLILLFKAIAKALNRSDTIKKRIGNEIDEILVKPDEASLLLLQTNHDSRGHFADYIRTGTYPDPNSAETFADRQLLLAMKECEGFVKDWQEKVGSLVELYRHLKNQLFFIFYAIEDEGLVYYRFRSA